MADTFTAKNWPVGKAPKRLTLLGDKTKRPEPAQHIIEFPGGAIELSRTTEGNYWAHIIINRTWGDADFDGLHAALGEVVGSRIGRTDGPLDEIPAAGSVTQIAVLIKPVRASLSDREPEALAQLDLLGDVAE